MLCLVDSTLSFTFRDELKREARKLRKELTRKETAKEDIKISNDAPPESDALREYREEKAKYLSRGELKKLGLTKESRVSQSRSYLFKTHLYLLMSL